jgi:hypothetical protein
MRTAAPMLPLRFFRSRVFTAGALASTAMYAALFGALFLITQLLQTGPGHDPAGGGPGAGAAVFFAPLATAMLSAVTPEEQGQASGAATAIRELAVVFGVAGLGLVFAGHGGYASRADFAGGFVAAMWLAAGLAAAGVLAAVALPRRPARGLTDPRARCDNDARDAVSAGAAR